MFPEPVLLWAGAPAPDFALPDQDSQLRRLQEWRGSYVVLFFFPKAFTPGCTQEVQRLRGIYQQLAEHSIVLVGISRDRPQRLRRFRDRYQLPFLLLSDAHGQVCRAYEALHWFGLPRRRTYIINPEGFIVRRYDKVKPHRHHEDLLAFFKNIRVIA